MQTMCNVSRSSEVMEHGIFTSVPERAIVASRKLSLARGVGNWKDLFPCMRACSSRAFSNQYVSYRLSKGCIRKAILFILWPWSPEGFGCVSFPERLYRQWKEKGWVTGHHPSMAETHGRASLGWFLQMSAHMEAPKQAQCTEHYLHLCSVCNTLFNRTPGEISLCLSFHITTEKAGLPSVPSSVGDSPKSCHFWLQALSNLLKECASLTCGLFSYHNSSVPYPVIFSSTRPVKGHFYLLHFFLCQFVLTPQIILSED